METKKAKKTDEERFGVIPEPGHTCPAIDESIDVVRMIRDGVRRAMEGGSDGLSDVVGLCGELEYDLLERIRWRASDLRQWGGEWRELHLKLSEEHADLVADAKMGRDW